MTTQHTKFHPAIVTAIAINLAILVLSVAWSGSHASQWQLLAEDGIVEWMQFLSFAVIAALLGFVAVTRMRRLGRIKLEVVGLIGLSALVALAALEEVSWFQRVLGLTTPDFFVQNNRQAETNLHNLALGSGSLHKTVLLKLILIVGLTHNLVLPLLARSRPAIKQFVESLGLYLPPLSASIPYLLLVILSHVLIDHPRKGELGEMFGAVHYLATVFVAYFVGLGYGKPSVIEHPSERSLISALFSMLMVFLLFVSWLLSAGYVSIPPQ